MIQVTSVSVLHIHSDLAKKKKLEAHVVETFWRSRDSKGFRHAAVKWCICILTVGINQVNRIRCIKTICILFQVKIGKHHNFCTCAPLMILLQTCSDDDFPNHSPFLCQSHRNHIPARWIYTGVSVWLLWLGYSTPNFILIQLYKRLILFWHSWHSRLPLLSITHRALTACVGQILRGVQNKPPKGLESKPWPLHANKIIASQTGVGPVWTLSVPGVIWRLFYSVHLLLFLVFCLVSPNWRGQHTTGGHVPAKMKSAE